MLNDKELGNLLLDYYGELLTKHQRGILEEYFKEDLSMIEIAENYNISKSAVSDLIKRSLKQLNDYESKLQLIMLGKRTDDLIERMRSEQNEFLDKYANELEEINRGEENV